MAEKIDMSLDDIIKKDKISTGRRRGQGAGAQRGRGGAQRGQRGGRQVGGGSAGPQRTPRFTRSRALPYSRPSQTTDKWQHDLFEGSGLKSRSSGARQSASHLMVSNLEFGVTDDDIKELFGEFGALRKAAIHYDRSGRSLGTADVVFERKADAVKALNKYNGVPLDGPESRRELPPLASSTGRAMKIQLMVENESNVSSNIGSRIGVPNRGRGGSGGTGGRSFRGGRGRGAPRGRGGQRGGSNQKKVPTAEELDAELDAYTNKM